MASTRQNMFMSVYVKTNRCIVLYCIVCEIFWKGKQSPD